MKSKTTPSEVNIKELRDHLLEMYQKLRDGKIGIKEAKEQANIAGKIISSAKVQMEYNIYIQSKKKIKFLDSNE